MGTLKLYTYNRITGYWNVVRTITVESDAEKWLEIFQKDDPRGYFKLGRVKPRAIPKWQAFSRNLEARNGNP